MNFLLEVAFLMRIAEGGLKDMPKYIVTLINKLMFYRKGYTVLYLLSVYFFF